MPVLPRRRTNSTQQLQSTVQHADQRALTWLATTDHRPLRPVLKATARAIEVLAPWVGVSAWLLADGTPRSRSAVARGWVAMAMAATIEDGIIKPVTHRGRPDPDRLPPSERRHSDPSTSAFPSGHTGAATAFAVATATEAPALRPLLGATALVVAYTQAYTGRHYASDAAVGFAVGAAAGVLARRLPIRRLTDRLAAATS